MRSTWDFAACPARGTLPGVRLTGTTLERDRPIPQFRLTEADTGRLVIPWDLKGRRALVLAFLHAGCGPCAGYADELAAAEDQFLAADALVYAVAPERIPPLATLVDADGGTAQVFLGSSGAAPTVILADRYGAAWSAFPGPSHDLPTVGEVAAAAWHMALSCAECSMPAWPEDWSSS